MDAGDDGFAERLRVAYHEAGHAVVGMRFGWDIDRIEISAGGGGFYRPGFTGVLTSLQGREDILVTLAGRLSESLITGRVRVATDEWLQGVIKRLRAGHNDNHDDFLVMRNLMAGDRDAPDDILIDEYRALEAETKSLLAEPAIRGGIEAVAQALLRQQDGELSAEAMAVVDDAEDEDAPSAGAERRREWDRLDRIALLVEQEASGLAADEDEPM